MTLSFAPDWRSVSNAGSGSAHNIPSSNLPVGEDVIVVWVLTNGSPTPVLATVTQLDAGAAPVGSAFTVINVAQPSGGLHVAWGTRHASLDSLQLAFSTGFTASAITLANVPAGSYGEVLNKSYPSPTVISETMPGVGVFAGTAIKGSGFGSFTDSTGDFSSDLADTSTQAMRSFVMETPTATETATFESFSGTGFVVMHTLGPAAPPTAHWSFGHIGWRG